MRRILLLSALLVLTAIKKTNDAYERLFPWTLINICGDWTLEDNLSTLKISRKGSLVTSVEYGHMVTCLD